MCESLDDVHAHVAAAEDGPTGTGLSPSRRQFLRGVASLGVGSVLLPGSAVFTRMASALASTPGGTKPPVPMAMHIHSSFSEGGGSMQAQLSEARSNGVPVIWFTEHDWRMSAHGYRQVVHFDSLTGEAEKPNKAWRWVQEKKGPLASSAGGIVKNPVSPLDTSTTPGALHVMAQSSSNSLARLRYFPDTDKARLNHKANLAGQRLQIEVFPAKVGPDAWLELQILLSNRPAMSGREAGGYLLSYRLGTAPASRTAEGLTGIISVPVTPGRWTSLNIKPVDDIARLWPDMLADDNSLRAIYLGATSGNRATAEGYFDYLRFHRDVAGDIPRQVQSRLVQAYQRSYPDLSIYQGMEPSLRGDHINWFGGDQHLIQYEGDRVMDPDPAFSSYASDLIHKSGGLSSTNHPFSAEVDADLTQPQQDAKRKDVTETLLGNSANHADILEAGYRSRGSCDLESHLDLWDTLSRNGVWLTGNGASDNHNAEVGSWATELNRFITYAWSGSQRQDDLLAALRKGQVFVGELGTFKGTVDVSVEGNPMGSISVQPKKGQRTVTVRTTGVPAGGSIEVVQGPVDYAGAGKPDPGTHVVSTVSSPRDGSLDVKVDTSTSSFVRVNVLDGHRTRVAFSNPVWLLREPPPTPVPPARRAPDT